MSKMDSLFSGIEAHDRGMYSVAIAKNGKIEYARGVGAAFIGEATNVSATSETKYRIGSITKTFAATIIFQLVEEKKLSLDDRLAKWFPQIPNATEITLDQMLTHHSGIHNFTDDSDYQEWSQHPRTHEEIVARIASATPDFAPDHEGGYSNSNYVLLGYIIEKVTGESYADQLNKRIVTRLGLKNTYYGSKLDPNKNEAMPYRRNSSGWKAATQTDMSIPGGAGAIESTPSDLTTFITALFQGKLVSDSSLKKMLKWEGEYGRGLMHYPFYSRLIYGHTGGIDGFYSFVGYFPEDSVAVALTCNGLDYDRNGLLVGALNIYYKMPYQIPNFERPKAIAVSPNALQSYVGVYHSNADGMDITIRLEGGQLTAQATGQGAFPLTPTAETEFQFDQAGIKMTFKKEASGAASSFVIAQNGRRTEFVRK
jgi:D-alanyl-D-alanine carboxypeptidase